MGARQSAPVDRTTQQAALEQDRAGAGSKTHACSHCARCGRAVTDANGVCQHCGLEAGSPYEPYEYEYIMDNPDTFCDVFPFLKLPAVVRGRALEYLLSASEARPADPGSDKRVPYSAAASLDTLIFHARDIKTVSKAIASDVRLIERRAATPRAWLRGLWDVEPPHDSGPGGRSHEGVLGECRARAKIGAHANLVLEMWNRLTTSCAARNVRLQTPERWSAERRDAVEQLFDEGIASSWAHVRVSTRDEAERSSPVEKAALADVLDSTVGRFGVKFAQHSWTLRADAVQLIYRGATEEGELVDADDAAYDKVDARLAQLFGSETERSENPRSAEPWIQAWANGDDRLGSTFSLAEARKMGWGHDESRPPVRRIRDVRDYNGTKPDSLDLTHKGTKSVGTVDLLFKRDAGAYAQAPDPPGIVPPFYFISPVANVRWRGRCKVKTNSTFKIGSRGTRLEGAVLFIELVPGVFDACISCTVAGLS